MVTELTDAQELGMRLETANTTIRHIIDYFCETFVRETEFSVGDEILNKNSIFKNCALYSKIGFTNEFNEINSIEEKIVALGKKLNGISDAIKKEKKALKHLTKPILLSYNGRVNNVKKVDDTKDIINNLQKEFNSFTLKSLHYKELFISEVNLLMNKIASNKPQTEKELYVAVIVAMCELKNCENEFSYRMIECKPNKRLIKKLGIEEAFIYKSSLSVPQLITVPYQVRQQLGLDISYKVYKNDLIEAISIRK